MLGLLWCFGLLIGHTCEQTPGGGGKGSAGGTDTLSHPLLPSFPEKRGRGRKSDDAGGAPHHAWHEEGRWKEDDRRSFQAQKPRSWPAVGGFF